VHRSSGKSKRPFLLPAGKHLIYFFEPKLFGIRYIIAKAFGELEKTSAWPLVAVLSHNQCRHHATPCFSFFCGDFCEKLRQSRVARSFE
jgi:hypothetical protein